MPFPPFAKSRPGLDIYILVATIVGEVWEMPQIPEGDSRAINSSKSSEWLITTGTCENNSDT